MISVLVDNPLSFWVTGTTEIRNILSLMKPCIDQLRTAGYTDCRAVVGGGVREQDTGYAAFFREYPSFSNMEEHLCDDFTAEELDLDGSWFDTLNFKSMTVGLEKSAHKGRLTYSGGKITLRFDDAEDELERQIQSILEPFQYRDPHKGGDSPSVDKASIHPSASSRGNNYSKNEKPNITLADPHKDGNLSSVSKASIPPSASPRSNNNSKNEKPNITLANSEGEVLNEKVKMMSQLRAEIIEHLKRENSVVPYVLENSYVNDLENSFDSRRQWNRMHFDLDLKGKRLYVEVETYPNQFGACFTDRLNLTPDRFGEIANNNHFRKALQFLNTQNDLDTLFDQELTNTISEVQKKEETARKEAAKLYAVKIPEQFYSRSPKMNIKLLELNLMQMYGSTTVSLKRSEDSYHLEEIIIYRTGDESKFSERDLTQAESVWVEKMLKETLDNPDNSEWHSYVGLDKMNINIQTASANLLLESIEPLNKYYDLMRILSDLSKYGSNKQVDSPAIAETTVDAQKEPTDTKKRTAIVFYSKHHGNTKKLIDAIAVKDNTVTLIDVNEQPDADLSSFDRIGLASGIYYSSFAKQIVAFAEANLPENKDVFYIYTHGAPIGSFLREIRAVAKKKNCREIGKYHCRGFDTFGPFGKIGGIAKGRPDENDISKAVDFYRAL